MENILLILIVGIINLLSFYFGSKLNNNAEKEKKEIVVNPVKFYKNVKERKKQEEEKIKEQQIFAANLENIENYDGTSLGQKDIP